CRLTDTNFLVTGLPATAREAAVICSFVAYATAPDRRPGRDRRFAAGSLLEVGRHGGGKAGRPASGPECAGAVEG
ncbi:hypothetical protein, partial [Nocardia fluminea]|uniref:hypothetical protein n=1 Tax=Nocardia fluminea TaxID=134984 RepID=UPI0033D560D1